MKKKKRYKKAMAVPPEVKWAERTRRLSGRLARENREGAGYLTANCDAVYRTVDGRGPDATDAHPSAGARITFNMSSVHLPGFCEATKAGRANAYKNCYDLAAESVTSGNHKHVNARRRLVDESLPLPEGASVENTYFGAVDVNGSGVRFYGDICLVLQRDQAASCVVLDRNSYDLVRSPVKEQLTNANKSEQDAQRRAIARSWSGSWQVDLGHIVAAKALATLPLGARRWTTGHISQAVCSDEDYVEVLKGGSFNALDLQEARLSANDIAEDALTSARIASRRPVPRLESMLWARRRARAEVALRSLGVPVRIIGHHGRIKT
jgi:hypothetical protein